LITYSLQGEQAGHPVEDRGRVVAGNRALNASLVQPVRDLVEEVGRGEQERGSGDREYAFPSGRILDQAAPG